MTDTSTTDNVRRCPLRRGAPTTPPRYGSDVVVPSASGQFTLQVCRLRHRKSVAKSKPMSQLRAVTRRPLHIT